MKENNAHLIACEHPDCGGFLRVVVEEESRYRPKIEPDGRVLADPTEFLDSGGGDSEYIECDECGTEYEEADVRRLAQWKKPTKR